MFKRITIKLKVGGMPFDTATADEELPPLLGTALDRASCFEERQKIEAFSRKFAMAVAGQNDDEAKLRLYRAVADADPGIYFDFCRRYPLNIADCRDFMADLGKEMASRCPGRETMTGELATFVARRLSGDQTARWPILHGLPGTGKSYMATILGESLQKLGIKTETVIHQAPQSAFSGDRLDEAAQSLVGTDSHWGNADSGSIYKAVCTADVALVLLDEVDKGMNRDFLVALLDPRLPLRDNFLKGFFPEMELRHKTLFVLTANDIWRLRRGDDDPLWSRLSPLEVPEYQVRQMEEVIVAKILDLKDSPYAPTPSTLRKLLRKARQKLGEQADFRALEDEVNRLLFLECVGAPKERVARKQNTSKVITLFR
ncbi:hypothetical protein [Geobacter anodireducens]